MSDLLFPMFRGLQYPIGKTPHWNTIVQESISGVKKFLQCYTYPYYTFNLSFSYLSDDDLKHDDIHTLMGFYNQIGGAGKDFLWADPLFEDNRCIKQTFGISNGLQRKYHLIHQYGSWYEPIYGIINKPLIYINGVETNAFEWSTSGEIIFNTAPTATATLAWTGKWFYRCHFQEDEAEFNQIFSGGWELEELVLESIKME